MRSDKNSGFTKTAAAFLSRKHVPTGLLVALLLVPFILPFWLVGIAWWPEIADLAHFFAFALIAALIVAACFHSTSTTNRLRCYLIAAGVTFLLASATELVQFFHAGRHGSYSDALYNIGGAACGLLFIAVLHKHLNSRFRVAAGFFVITVSVLAIQPLVREFFLLHVKEDQLPLLFGFESNWELRDIKARHARYLSDDELQPLAGHTNYYRFPKSHWSSLSFDHGWRHWGDYKTLLLKITVANNVQNEPLKLYFYYTHDQWEKERQRAEAHFSVSQGSQMINIPFNAIQRNGQPLDMNRTHILIIGLVKSQSDTDLVLALDEMRLR